MTRCGCWLNLLAAPADAAFPFPPAGQMSPYCYTCWRADQPVELHLWERPREAGGPVTPPPVQKPRRGLGDFVAWLLKKIGITPRLVAKLTGRPCNCRSRQARLNRWGWAVWDRVKKVGGRLFGHSRGT